MLSRRAADPRQVRGFCACRSHLTRARNDRPAAALRVLSARALEVEAGPVSGVVREDQLAPASDAAFIRHVSIQRYTTGSRVAFVRARVTLRAGCRECPHRGSDAYVDLTPMVALRPNSPSAPRSQSPRRGHSKSAGCACAAAEAEFAEQLRAGGSAGALTVDGNRSVPGICGETPADDVLRAVEGRCRRLNNPCAS